MKAYIEKQNFFPGFLAIFINPFYFARKGLYEGIRKFEHYISGKTLDVGCGKKPYQSLFKNVTQYIGMDIEESGHDHKNEDIDVFYDGHTFPFEDNSFDSMICNQVLEHVFNPTEFLSEMHRVLKQDGKVLLTVPFVWDEHEQPYDYARYSSFGLKHLVETAGFEVIEQQKTVQSIKVVFQLFNLYLYKKLIRQKNAIIRPIIKALIATPNNLFGLFWGFLLPKNEELYLDNIIVLKKIND